MRLFLAILVFANQVQATVLVQGPGTSTIEYRSALKADSDLASPTQTLLRKTPAGRDNLLALFAEAQKSFLDNSKGEAQAKFQNLVSLLSTEDWSQSDRSIFQLAYLRLAQMELSPEKQDYWITRSLLAGEDISPDKNLFPPPLLRRWMQIRNEIPRFTGFESWFREGWNTVLINGIPCTKTSCQGWPMISEKVRLSFLSDQWIPQSKLVDGSELSSAKVPRIAWVDGSCARSEFHQDASALPDKKAFWGAACDRPPLVQAQQLNLQPVASNEPIPKMTIKEKAPAFYKSKWFWIGVGVVTAGIVIASSQKKDDKKEPSTTYGY